MFSDHEKDPQRSIVSLVGYKRPPVHSRFKPGQSGNPSGRAKGSQNLKTLFNKILKEEVSLRDGADVRKVSKAEALMRGLVIGALKGDTRNLLTLFRLAEQTGQFDEPGEAVGRIERVIVSWKASGHEDEILPSATTTAIGSHGPTQRNPMACRQG